MSDWGAPSFLLILSAQIKLNGGISLKNTLKGYLIGVLSTVMLFGCVAYAASYTKTIEVIYDNIKVYKDNVLCETKDANGTVVEPFIYNGTTYMPVRGTANLAGMDVTWDGATKSVYLWDELVADETYLLDVCQPYETSNYFYTHMSSKGESFEMAGEKYSNGIKLGVHGWYGLFNLNGKYSTLNCTIGHVTDNQKEKNIYFFVDGKLIKKVTMAPEELPKKISIPLNYGLQLKIMSEKEDEWGYSGIANITVK